MVKRPDEPTSPSEDDDDPIWHAALLAAIGGEDEARLAYGDATTDAAIARVTAEEGI